MEMIILFEKIQLNQVICGKEKLGFDLGQAAKNINNEKDDSEIHVQLLEGQVPGASENENVIILISSDKVMYNCGPQIVKFKEKAIKIFLQNGIDLDMNSLAVKLKAPYDVKSFVNKVKKINENKNLQSHKEPENDEFDYEQKSKQYVPVDPLYSFDRVILPKEVIEKIEEAIGILECENKVFNEWGLYEIQPHPSTSLSFYGSSGTGKTMAAEAIANKLGKKILKVSYADVESKYHGEGPKMVKSIFLAAKNSDAVLFFDEADSLLSKRLTSVSQGSEQAINSMRSQLLICLEEFRGIVIFATNLVVNYDQAFLTRLISVEFVKPDVDTRETIWDIHIKAPDDKKQHKLNIPLSDNVNTKDLASKYNFVGREIRNAVVSACVAVAIDKRDIVEQEDLIKACDKIKLEKESLEKAKNNIKSNNSKKEIPETLKKVVEEKIKIKEGEKTNVFNITE